jgi:hypothetical protein
MLRIIENQNLRDLITKAKIAKEEKDRATKEYNAVMEEIKQDPILQQSIYNELCALSKKGTSLTTSVEVYDAAGNKRLSVTKVGWSLSLSQTAASKYYHEHPEACVIIDQVLKAKAKPFIKEATTNPQLLTELGVTYKEETPYYQVA